MMSKADPLRCAAGYPATHILAPIAVIQNDEGRTDTHSRLVDPVRPEAFENQQDVVKGDAWGVAITKDGNVVAKRDSKHTTRIVREMQP